MKLEGACKTIRLILGDQLNLKHSWFSTSDPSVLYVLAEVRSESDYVKHHIQKLCAFFLSMSNFAQELRELGHQVRYYTLQDTRGLQSFADVLKPLLEETKAERFEYQEPDEFRLDQHLKQFAMKLKIKTKSYSTQHFFTDREELSALFKGKKTYVLETFYRKMRLKHDILMEDGAPIGGAWNFDQENRKKLPKDYSIPKRPVFSNNVTDILKQISLEKVDHFGKINPKILDWPIDRKQALSALDFFCQNLLLNFGNYQDAMHTQERNLFHSRLSFALNVKLISPKEVVDSAIEVWRKKPKDRSQQISISQIEGFVRQILGWREFMRGVYWASMPAYSEMNFFNHQADLPKFYWTGKTNMNCLRHAIEQSLEDAYAHHIQRLMITGNFALLAGISPDQLDAWYLGIYIDAIEWVEITNTRGMSQFADGGILASKPYVSSANYINKMSNYCQNCYYDHKQRIGPKACPFNSLYWDFFIRHRDKLSRNPRIGMAYRNLDKLKNNELVQISKQADYYRTNIETI